MVSRNAWCADFGTQFAARVVRIDNPDVPRKALNALHVLYQQEKRPYMGGTWRTCISAMFEEPQCDCFCGGQEVAVARIFCPVLLVSIKYKDSGVIIKI